MCYKLAYSKTPQRDVMRRVQSLRCSKQASIDCRLTGVPQAHTLTHTRIRISSRTYPTTHCGTHNGTHTSHTHSTLQNPLQVKCRHRVKTCNKCNQVKVEWQCERDSQLAYRVSQTPRRRQQRLLLLLQLVSVRKCVIIVLAIYRHPWDLSSANYAALFKAVCSIRRRLNSHLQLGWSDFELGLPELSFIAE